MVNRRRTRALSALRKAPVALAATVGLLVGYSAHPTPSAPHTAAVVPACHVRAAGQLPDPACTPGQNDPASNSGNLASTVCKHGYSATVRHTSQALKDRVLRRYGFVPGAFAGELDHLIPLSMGGADSEANLWPELGPIPNPKDTKVEGPLRAAVCDGLVALDVAQARIAADWRTAMTGVPK